MSLFSAIGSAVSSRATLAPEEPGVVQHRRLVVGVVLVVGAVLLGFSLTREPGSTSFYWLSLILAVVWGLGARLSGPLHVGWVRYGDRRRRPVITGTVIGLLVGAVFVVGGLVVREIPPVRDYIVQVLQYANSGPLWFVAFITCVNGLAEEVFFRGALFSALGRHRPVLISTVVYVIAVSAAGNPMLGFAGAILGVVCAYERRMTGGVLAPMLTHFVWGLVMVLALPPIFGA